MIDEIEKFAATQDLIDSLPKEPVGYTVFNINEWVLAKLTDEGYQQWKAYDDAAWEHLPEFVQAQYPKKPLLVYQAKANAQGYCEFQAWQLMQIMGPKMSLGSLLFDSDILLKTKDLEPAVSL